MDSETIEAIRNLIEFARWNMACEDEIKVVEEYLS